MELKKLLVITAQAEIRISSALITDRSVLIIIRAVTTVITDRVVITETITIKAADTTAITDKADITEIITTRVADIIATIDNKAVITGHSKADIKIVLNRADTIEAEVSKTEDLKAVTLTVRAASRIEDPKWATETELLNSFL